MGFDIPEPFKWDESFQVFYANLDEEHRGLFDGIFDLVNDPGSAAVKQTLYDRCKNHFTNEEGMMQAKSYPDYPSHKGLHDKFLADLSGVALPLGAKEAKWAKEWLVNHIKGTDFKYKGKL